ncbi:MAG: lysophospholipid acyltransferase family protein [Polyangiales bacterium]
MGTLGTVRRVPVARLLARLVAQLPFRTLGTPGALLGLLAHDVLRIRRGQVHAAMARAAIDDRRTARAMFRSLGQGALELLWLSGRPDIQLAPHVRVDGWERYEAARALGRGVIVATAHTGNWDLTACACAERVAPAKLTIVTKRLRAKGLDAFWQETRRARGIDLVTHDEGIVPAIRERLARGHAVALLVDQDPERTTSVVAAEFLGAMALHDALPATMSARTGAPIVVAFARREGDDGARHVVEVVDVLFPPPRPSAAWIAETTRLVAAHLDAFVRRDPASWLWLHRRWKTQHHDGRPTGEHGAPVVVSAARA